VHGGANVETDLSGRNVLLSHDFYYFGSRAIELPDFLLPICHQTQGHRSESNAPYFDRFVKWLRGLQLVPGQLYGWPDYVIDWKKRGSCGSCSVRELDGQADTPC
jgi:hypothetical protein